MGTSLVGGVFLQLLLHDPESYLVEDSAFHPAGALGLERFQSLADLASFVEPQNVGRLDTLEL